MNDIRNSLVLILIIFICQFTLATAQTWMGNGPNYKNIKTITQSPTNPNLLYAGAFGWGVFKSIDGGASWINVKTGMTNTHVRSIVAISDNIVFAGTNDGVFKTINGGVSWISVLTTINSVRSLVYDSKSGSLYAATYGSGLYKSTDQGTNWAPRIVNDPTTAETMPHLWSVAIFGKDSLYAGGSILDITVGGALFSSVNGGMSWFQVQYPIGIRSSVKSIAISPNDPTASLIIGTAAKGVYKSINAGTNWTEINAGTTPNPIIDKRINTVGFNTTFRYAGTDSLGKFYYRSLGDISNGWLSGTGLPGAQAMINDIDINPLSRNTVYVGTDGQGVYKSIDSGFTWLSSYSGMLGTAGRTIKLNSNGNLILGTDFGDGIWISTNQAVSWTRADSLTTSNSITSIGITNLSSTIYASDYGTGVYKSIDGGHIWHITDSTVINHFIRSLIVHPLDANVVFSGTGNGVYKTINGGTSWLASSNGIPVNTSVRSLEIDISNPNVIYAGTDSSYMFKTIDAGANWSQISNLNGFLVQDKFIRTITIDHMLPNIIYAGSDSGRIYKSNNSGSSWNLLFKLPITHSVRSILINPNDRKILFTGTFGDGIFVSVDSGSHWTSYNSGLTDLDIYSLESDNANPLNLYAGSGSHGVFHTTFSFLNRSPIIAAIGNKSTFAGQTFVFTVSAIDSDGTIPTLSVTGLPTGAVFTDSLNGHAGFSWTPNVAQVGNYHLTFFASDGSLAVSQAIVIYVLDSTSSTILNLQLESGWNLISEPLVVADFQKSTLFPSATSQAFAYASAYIPYDTLIIGTGYWLKYLSAEIVQIVGNRLMRDTIDITDGWNMIGPLSDPIPIANVIPIAPMTVISNYFGYSVSSGYTNADTLLPGKGYWMKVNQPGKIILTSSGVLSQSVKNNPDLINMVEDGMLSRLTFINPDGSQRQLFLSVSNNSMLPQKYELPPLAPLETFDVRFASQSTLAIVDGGNSGTLINITGAGSPVTIRWEINVNNIEYSLELFDESNHSYYYKLSTNGDAIINNANLSHAVIRIQPKQLDQLPKDFVLEQNYPNPFNPNTTLRYALPVDAKVTLTIYNLIGKEITTLVDKMQEKGYHSMEWNAESMTTGVYFYILRVSESETGKLLFQSSKKLILVK